MISRNAVKESFDTLPAGICCFNRNGLLRLVNHKMQSIAAILCGRDLQTLADLQQALHSPGGGVCPVDAATGIYRFPDGTVYRFVFHDGTDKQGVFFTEVMAFDVSRQAALHAELAQENERLADANRRAKRLYDNMPDIVREEEILKMKMRVHDDIGHTLIAARRALRHGQELEEIRRQAAEWQRAIDLLCRAGQEDTAYDPLEHMQKRAAALGVTVWLYADSARSGQQWQLCIKNNGLPPTKTVREGGGLSSLRRRIEKAGGTMTVHSLPNFVLEITLPHKEELP